MCRCFIDSITKENCLKSTKSLEQFNLLEAALISLPSSVDLATVDPTNREREETSLQIIHNLHEAFKASSHAQAEVVSFVDSEEVQVRTHMNDP